MEKSPSRKAQVGNSFTWLFVIIAGSAFLFLFYQVIQAQLSDAADQQVTQELDAATDIINTLYTSTNTNQTLPGFQSAYDVVCEDQTAHLSPPDTPATQQLTPFPIYAPETLPTANLNVVSVQYEAPMPITTVLFLIPEATTIPYHQDNDPVPTPLQPYLDTQLSEISTTPMIKDTTHPINKAGYALNNTELATCTTSHIHRQSKTAYQTLRDKAESLNQTISREDCQEIYDSTIGTLQSLINRYQTTDPTEMPEINDAVTDLTEANDALITNTCPELY